MSIEKKCEDYLGDCNEWWSHNLLEKAKYINYIIKCTISLYLIKNLCDVGTLQKRQKTNKNISIKRYEKVLPYHIRDIN